MACIITQKRLQVPHCRKRNPERTSSGSRIDGVIADIVKLPFSEHIQAKRVSVSTVIKKGINFLSTGDGSFTCFPTLRPVGRPLVCCASQIQIAFPCSVVKKGSRRLHGSVVSEITHSLEFQAANSKTYASALDKAARMLLLKHFHEPISVLRSFF